MSRNCLDCDTEIVGRADKRFCSDECRNNYHNRKNRATTNYIRQVNRSLRKNRSIMAELAPGGKAKIKQRRLTERGFEFRYHTNTYTTKKGQTYFFCYDYGYLPLKDNYFLLVQREAD